MSVSVCALMVFINLKFGFHFSLKVEESERLVAVSGLCAEGYPLRGDDLYRRLRQLRRYSHLRHR